MYLRRQSLLSSYFCAPAIDWTFKTKKFINAFLIIPIVIHNQTSEIADSFKNFGVTLNSSLTFDQHISNIHKKSHQRLLAIHELKGLHVAPNSYCCCIKVSFSPFCCTVPPASTLSNQYCLKSQRSPHAPPHWNEWQSHYCKMNRTGLHTHPQWVPSACALRSQIQDSEVSEDLLQSKSACKTWRHTQHAYGSKHRSRCVPPRPA